MKKQNINKTRIKNRDKGFNQLYAFGKKASIDLSLSENPLGFSKLVNKEFSRCLIKLNDYPDVRLTRFRSVLATKFNLESKDFFIGNGSESILINLAKILLKKNDEVVTPKLTFPMFDVAAQLVGSKVFKAEMANNLKISLDNILTCITKKTKVIFICNPNNPTGDIIAKKNLIVFLGFVPKDVTVIIDEANIEFGGESLIEETKRFSNLIIIRTFSKGFGLAALRIGFCVASSKIIDLLQAETQPFPISSISEKLAIVALQDNEFLQLTKNFVDSQREFMVKEMQALGFRIFPSQSNNLFVKIPDSLDEKQFFRMIENADISLVKGSSFPGFDNSFFRLSPRDEDTNKLFLREVAKITERLKTKIV